VCQYLADFCTPISGIHMITPLEILTRRLPPPLEKIWKLALTRTDPNRLGANVRGEYLLQVSPRTRFLTLHSRQHLRAAVFLSRHRSNVYGARLFLWLTPQYTLSLLSPKRSAWPRWCTEIVGQGQEYGLLQPVLKFSLGGNLWGYVHAGLYQGLDPDIGIYVYSSELDMGPFC